MREWTKDIDQKAQNLEDEDIADQFYEMWAEDMFIMDQHKVILMNSFLTFSFALFEHHLTTLCGHAQRRRCIPFSVGDLKAPLQTAQSLLNKA